MSGDTTGLWSSKFDIPDNIDFTERGRLWWLLALAVLASHTPTMAKPSGTTSSATSTIRSGTSPASIYHRPPSDRRKPTLPEPAMSYHRTQGSYLTLSSLK